VSKSNISNQKMLKEMSLLLTGNILINTLISFLIIKETMLPSLLSFEIILIVAAGILCGFNDVIILVF